MFFIIGARPKVSEQRVLTMVCWRCGKAAAHRMMEVRNHLTLFFVPLIPLGTKRTLQCLLCGADQELTQDQAEDIREHASSQETNLS